MSRGLWAVSYRLQAICNQLSAIGPSANSLRNHYKRWPLERSVPPGFSGANLRRADAESRTPIDAKIVSGIAVPRLPLGMTLHFYASTSTIVEGAILSGGVADSPDSWWLSADGSQPVAHSFFIPL